ncbi:uncharacterized protein C16orf78 homolog [Bufo gargarizans]|uniref:uncharacterized protein C16orf78 homolog n=1 Tax=Bufo gargarizans TaxID=30331 RepID=UPI001CF40826|nr:uncharacterized protein C16orf78 homolog [Bufo gargarizans]
MRSHNDNVLKQEEMKLKRNLAKLTDLSNVSKSGLYRTIYKKPSSFVLVENQQKDTRQDMVKAPDVPPAALSSNLLPKMQSLLHQPVWRLSSADKRNTHNCAAFNGVDVTVNTPRPPSSLRKTILLKSLDLHNRESTLRWLGQELSHMSSPELDVLLPPQHKLSGYKFQYNSASTDSTLERRLGDQFFKAWKDKCKRSLSSYIPPDDVLRCRYLRLSENNIASLLQKCKESGIHVDIHPHMKESDIDISTVMSSESSNTVSL